MTDDLIKRLRACAEDPMWADHCEMSKTTVLRAADEIERLRGIVPEVLERLNDDLCAENERLRAALQMAVRQNEHDMLMTGDELRACRAALGA